VIVFPGYLEVVKLLVEHGADITLADRTSQASQPLHIAAASGHVGTDGAIIIILTA